MGSAGAGRMAACVDGERNRSSYGTPHYYIYTRTRVYIIRRCPIGGPVSVLRLRTLPSGLRPRCPCRRPACARAAHAAIRPPPSSSAPFTAHAVPPSSSAVLLRPLPSSSAARCPLSSALRRTAVPKSSLLLPDFNLQSMLCSIIPKDFREKIWRVGVKCRSLQSAPEEKREKKQSAVVRRNHLRTRAKGLAFPSRDFLRDKNISEKIWREVKKCVLLHSLNGTRVL